MAGVVILRGLPEAPQRGPASGAALHLAAMMGGARTAHTASTPRDPYPMVDCFDRIAVQMTELALEPVRLLGERTMLGSVSLRTPSGGRRYLVTIAKRFPDGDDRAPGYVWLVEEIGSDGAPLHEGPRRASPAGIYVADPEAAYWAAVAGLCEDRR